MSPDPGPILERELLRLGLGNSGVPKLTTFLRELERWNKKLNLTSLQSQELVRRLVSEPAWIGRQLQMSGVLADIGSGNGSPGLPLYITCGLNRVHLVESRVRRAAFLRHIASILDPRGIVVHRGRVEEVGQRIPIVDWISIQAVHPSPKLLESLHPMCGPTTRVVWITSGGEAPAPQSIRLEVPTSNTVAWIFQLDQF